MKSSVVVFFLFFISMNLGAQIPLKSEGTIEGKVIEEESGKAVEFATVSVFAQKDSSLITGIVSDPQGVFSIKVPYGIYYLKIEFVTYEDKIISDVIISKGNKNVYLKKILLVSSTKELTEVVVQAERTQMQLTLDKKIYNVGKDLSNLGGSASDLLDNLPSVTVDVEGNVQLRGSTNVKVLIDGKPSGIVGLSSTDALRQMQGNLIERVEIVTNPSARYDAEGQAGIINIVLKKEKQKGVNGSFQLNSGIPHNHGASLNMNLRRDWLNLFVNYGLNYEQNPGSGGGLQKFFLQDTTYSTDVNRHHIRGGLSNNIRLGADFFLNKKNTITTSFLFRSSDEQNDTNLTYDDFDQFGDELGYTLRNDLESEIDKNLEFSLNYTKLFTREGHKLTADVQYQNNNEIEESDIVQYGGSNASNTIAELFQQVRNDEGEERLMIQSDYVQPFGSKTKLEMGFRSTFREVKNIYNVAEKVTQQEEYYPLDTFSTDFEYNENVHAFYVIISNEMDKFSWQAGLRSESTDINTAFNETGQTRNWNYTNLFPSAFLTYKLSRLNQLQLSYSRRINRPRFRELNPFSSFSDNRNFRVGNPELQPEFTNSYELGFLQNLEKSSLYYGFYHRHTTQLIQRVSLEPNENGERIRIPYNIGIRNAYGLEINATHDFTKWYRVSGNFNIYNQNTSGSAGDTISLSVKAFSFTSRISQVIKIKNLFDAQINVNYRAPEKETQGRRLAMTVVDIGLSRDIWSNNGTISLGVRDLFNSRKYQSVVELPTFYEETLWQWRRGPQVQVTLTYRLNQRKQRSRGDGNEFGGDSGF
jgi:outer membrane receptor protein involved in Fe transport